MTKQEYEKHLDTLLDEVFKAMVSQSISLRGLAEKADLAVSTVSLINSRITRLPRLKTVMLLAEAVGLDVRLVAQQLKTKTTPEKTRGK